MSEKSLSNLYATKSDKVHTHAGTDITSVVANATNAVNATNATNLAGGSLNSYYAGAYNSSTKRLATIHGDFAGDNPSTTANAGAITGLSLGHPSRGKYSIIAAVSEDSMGFSRMNGLAFYTSPMDTDAIERVRISNNGYMCIGGTDPKALLDVRGSILSNGKTVATTDQIPTTLPANGGNAATVGGLSASQILRNDTGNQTLNGANSTPVLNLASSSGKFQFYCYSDGTNYIQSCNASGGSSPLHIGGIGDAPTNIALNGTVSVNGDLYSNGIIRASSNNYAIFGPNTTWGAYLRIGGDGNDNTTTAAIATTNGNIHLDSKPGAEMYLNYYAGTKINFGNGTKAIKSFIDSNGVFNGTSTSIPTSDVGGNIWIG